MVVAIILMNLPGALCSCGSGGRGDILRMLLEILVVVVGVIMKASERLVEEMREKTPVAKRKPREERPLGGR